MGGRSHRAGLVWQLGLVFVLAASVTAGAASASTKAKTFGAVSRRMLGTARPCPG